MNGWIMADAEFDTLFVQVGRRNGWIPVINNLNIPPIHSTFGVVWRSLSYMWHLRQTKPNLTNYTIQGHAESYVQCVFQLQHRYTMFSSMAVEYPILSAT